MAKKLYRIEQIETRTYRTIYQVSAESEDEAWDIIKEGNCEPVDHIDNDDEDWTIDEIKDESADDFPELSGDYSKPRTTVKELVEDLENLFKQGYLSRCSYTVGEHDVKHFATGVSTQGDIVIIRTKALNEDDEWAFEKLNAITIAELLEMLKDEDGDSGIVIQEEWKLLNLHYDDIEESFLFFDEDTGDFHYNSGGDFRLHSAKEVIESMAAFADKFPYRKVACVTEKGNMYPVMDIDTSDYHTTYLYCNFGDRDITTSDFDDDSFCEIAEFTGVAAILDDQISDKGLTKNIIPDNKGNLFFKAKYKGENVIAFKLGETLKEL